MRTPWTPWTPSHSVKKYLKKDNHEHGQWKKNLVQKKYLFFWSKGGVQGVLHVQYDNGKEK